MPGGNGSGSVEVYEDDGVSTQYVVVIAAALRASR
jgi:hypothetical protein